VIRRRPGLVRWGMRAIALVLALGLPAAALADATTRELAQGYSRELAACQTRASGVTKIAAGAQVLVDDGQAERAADLAALRAGLVEVTAYCAELTATLAMLADPNAAYRALERKLDEQDNKIRKLRARTKQVLDDLGPVTARIIPLVNARVGAPAPPAKKVHVAFPSGRALDAPALAGAYRTSGNDALDALDYAEAKASATLTARRLPAATCAQQRQAITAPGAADVAATDATRPLGLAWYVGYARSPRRVRVACRALAAGVVVVSLDEPLAAAAWPELEPVLAALLAAQ
jgi:hypothetical protein